MEQIRIPFHCKSLAHELGVQFDLQTRSWYIPDGTSDEIAQRMRDLEFMDENPENSLVEDENLHTNEDTNSIDLCNNIDTQISHHSDISWGPILEKEDTLYTAMMIRDYGMPEDENTRTLILRLLGRRHPGDYPIKFDDLCVCSTDFSNRYPDQVIENLVMENITSSERYEEQIRDSQTMTDEEKALLLFVLPV